MQTLLKENPLILIGVGILAIGFAPKILSGEFAADQATSAALVQQRKADEIAIQRLAISQEKRKELEAIANQRYEGCTVVVSTDDIRKATGLTIGQPVLDGTRRGTPIADGITVCDQNGMTAEIINGVAANPAPTSNRAVVEAALRRFGYDGTLSGKLHYSAPKQ